MAERKTNSGGKKFQTRQTGEKRSRVKPPIAKKNNSKFGKNTEDSAIDKGVKNHRGEGNSRNSNAGKRGSSRTGFVNNRSRSTGDSGSKERRNTRNTGRDDSRSAIGKRGKTGRTGKFINSDTEYTEKRTNRYSDTRNTDRKPNKFSNGGKKDADSRGVKTDKLGSNRRSSGRKSGNEIVPKNYKDKKSKYSKTSKQFERTELLENEEVRLNRYIANSGLCSRREADEMIAQGLVKVNGKVVTELGTKVFPKDEVKVDDKRISPEKPVYILLNKPKGYLTTTDDPEGRATVMELIDIPGRERIYPVGRLDRNTTGVLLLTNDGELSQKLMHPSFEIKKVYKAKLDRKPSKEHMLAWVNGIELEDGWMSFEQIGFVDDEDNTILGLEIHSGKNRIVRRMFEHFEYEVKSLDRVLLGELDKMKLGRGKWRFLTDKELGYIDKLKRMKPKRKQ